MPERPNPGAKERRRQPRTEVRLVKNLNNPQDLADRTGGTLIFQGPVPWRIVYKTADILWAGHPHKPSDVSEATPFVEVKFPKPYGSSLGVQAVILRRDSAMFISPGFFHDDVVMGQVFSEGEVSEFQTPVGSASRSQLKARKMARRESQRYMTSPTPKKIRIERV